MNLPPIIWPNGARILCKVWKAKIGNAKQPLFGGTELDRVYYSAFGENHNYDNNMLQYDEDIQYQKEVEVDKACIKALDKYIGAKLVVPGKN